MSALDFADIWVQSRCGNRTFVFYHRKPSKELMCELRKRIVACAHDHDAITTTGQPDQHIATGAAVWKSKGLSAAPLDFANNIVAPDAALDRATEIDGLGHDQNILIAQTACETTHEGVLHQTNRAVAMGLKHQQQAAGESVQGFERGGYFVGVVRKIVNYGNSICGAHDLQSTTDAAELA